VNSVEALDVAVRALSARVTADQRLLATYAERPMIKARVEEYNAALETLVALRQVIIDNDARLAELAEEARS